MDLGIGGRVAVVTGAESGIGLATAGRLLDEGARVVMTDTDAERLAAAVDGLRGRGDVRGLAADLVDVAHAQTLERHVAQELGEAEILVHAATSTVVSGAFDQLTDDDWRTTLDGDFLSAVRLLRAFLPHMRRARWGRVVLVAAEDAVQPSALELPYAAAKAATLNLAKGLSKTLAPEGILVNAVSPAFVATPVTDRMMADRAHKEGTSVDEAVRSFLASERPGLALGRRGRAEEVATAIAFLCSDLASFCVRANLRVDGGSVATV